MKYTSNMILALGLGLAGMASAQTDSANAALKEKVTNLEGQVNGINESYLETKGTVDKLAKIKVGGYIQAQWQHADSIGSAVGPVQGGAFTSGSANQRIQLRRVRLKTTYDNVTSQYIMEFEARPSGLSLKDAEVVLREPWLNTFALKIGLQDRPFGFEIPYSSSAHESPERSRGENIVFNGEKDLGVNLEVFPTDKMGLLQYFNLKGGVFTGTAGYNGGTGDEIDSTVDFIGRAGFKLPFNDLNLAVDGGVSYYGGKSQDLNDTVYAITGTTRTSTIGHKNGPVYRSIIGADLQVYYTIPVVGDIVGGSSLRGGFMTGNTPGTIDSSGPYGASASPTPIFDRNFTSWYVQWVQNFGTMFQGVLRYDVYDPNTDVSGSDIGAAGKGLGVADVKYSTLGIGGIYFWDSAVKVTAYYDMVTNEEVNAAATGSLAPYKKDLKDNIFTLRAQVKF